jgi:hypothetical protein
MKAHVPPAPLATSAVIPSEEGWVPFFGMLRDANIVPRTAKMMQDTSADL